MSVTCTNCGRDDNKVLQTTHNRNVTYRRRICNNCSLRFTTAESLLTERKNKHSYTPRELCAD